MKKLLNISVCLILTISIGYAQVPQGVGYQGVATDANGIELVNQAISIRASVLSGSATGTIEWEETHSTSTDTFGLFTLTIGQGTNTTNGIQTNFADISWGTNTHYLKIEMDVTGGTNYSFMGTNQMMSVPYALYAENANINYDSISNFLSGDSTFITNVGGGMGGGGCDFLYPDGLDGEPITVDLTSGGSFSSIPSGKNLYITNLFSQGSHSIKINNIQVTAENLNSNATGDAITLHNPLILESGDDIYNLNNSGSGCGFHGFLIDAHVDPITVDLSNGGSFSSVPAGKRLYITNLHTTGTFGVYINNIKISDAVFVNLGNSSQNSIVLQNPIILTEGDVISTWQASGQIASFNGYLVDENYFAACGGGGGSSSTTINYDSLANIISMDSTFITTVGGGIGGGSGGCDFNYPEGLDGEVISEEVWYSNEYTVPAGKRLYITNATVDGNSFLTLVGIGNGKITYPNEHLSQPIIVNAGEKVATAYDAYHGRINGYLVDETNDVIGVSEEVWSSNEYTVPAGKRLYITNAMVDGSAPLTLVGPGNGRITYANEHLSQPIIVNAGEKVATGYPSLYGRINGYLVDENYFAGCGGGGGSSSASAGLDSATVASMIANAVSNSSGSSVPIGVVQAYSGTTAPTGWLLCDGSAVSSTTYADLFSLIDTTYGSGDGSTTFNLPDLRGRAPVGKDNMGGNAAGIILNNGDTLGNIAGEETHTLTVAEMPSHSHSITANNGNNWGGVSKISYRSPTTSITNWTGSTNPSGGDQAHNNMPPYLIINYIIKY